MVYLCTSVVDSSPQALGSLIYIYIYMFLYVYIYNIYVYMSV